MKNTLQMNLQGWQLQFEANFGSIFANITRHDGAIVMETGEDILGDRGENVLAYELTANYGLVKQEQMSEPIKASLQGLDIELQIAQSGNLHIFCSGVSGSSIEHLDLTNGTDHSPSCELELETVQ